MTAPLAELHESIVSVLHGSASTNSDRQLHYLPRVWSGSQTTRPALCGQRRLTWKPISTLATRAVDWPLCGRCVDEAERITNPAPPEKIVHTVPTRGRTAELPIDHRTVLPNTAAERVQRRAAFRDSFPLSADASTYLIRRDYAPGISNQS